MLDFDTIRIRVPYRASVHYRDKWRDLEVDDVFEVPVVSVSLADAPLVATLRCNHRNDADQETFDFRAVDVRLFRPFRVRGQYGLWTAGRCRDPAPIHTLKASEKPLQDRTISQRETSLRKRLNV